MQFIFGLGMFFFFFFFLVFFLVFCGFPKLRVPFGGPSDKDCNILGSTLGFPY